MTRVASLYLPQLAIERLRGTERPAGPLELEIAAKAPLAAIDDDPGACSVPRGGGWRPGARWARDGVLGGRNARQHQIDALPAHQRPTMREIGRRALEISRELVLAAMEDKPFDLPAAIAELTQMADDYCLGPSTQCIVAAATKRKIPIHVLIGNQEQQLSLRMETVRGMEEQMTQRGIPVQVEILRGHDNYYPDLAARINKQAWEFLGKQSLPGDPVFRDPQLQIQIQH